MPNCLKNNNNHEKYFNGPKFRPCFDCAQNVFIYFNFGDADCLCEIYTQI